MFTKVVNRLTGSNKFYKHSDVYSQNFNDSPDLEKKQSTWSHEDIAAGSLYIYDQLVHGMGFPKTMVKNILLYDRDLINDDVNKAVEFLIKTEQGWLHTFVPETDVKFTPNEFIYNNSLTEELKEK